MLESSATSNKDAVFTTKVDSIALRPTNCSIGSCLCNISNWIQNTYSFSTIGAPLVGLEATRSSRLGTRVKVEVGSAGVSAKTLSNIRINEMNWVLLILMSKEGNEPDNLAKLRIEKRMLTSSGEEKCAR
jgi:hypothetical protein